MSQYELHFRAVLNMAFPTSSDFPPVRSFIGTIKTRAGVNGDTNGARQLINNSFNVLDARSYWYGRQACEENDLLAHIIVSASAIKELIQKCKLIGADISNLGDSENVSGRILLIVSNKEEARLALPMVSLLNQFDVSFNIKIASAILNPSRVMSLAKEATDCGHELIIASCSRDTTLVKMIDTQTNLPVIGHDFGVSPKHDWHNDIVYSGNITETVLLAIKFLSIVSIDESSRLQEMVERYRTQQEFENLQDSLCLDQEGLTGLFESS
jgi:hypothetical protein